MIRNSSEAMEAMANGEISKEFMKSVMGIPFYMSYTAPTDESSPIAFERHFNPALKYDSAYFNKLNAMIKCVENNQGSATSVGQ